MKKNILTIIVSVLLSTALFAQKLEFVEKPGKADENAKLIQPEKVLLIFETDLNLHFKSSMENLNEPVKFGKTYQLFITQTKCIITIADQDENKADISFGNLGANFPPLNKGDVKYFEILLRYPLECIDQTLDKKRKGIIDNQMLYEKEALVFFTLDPPDMELQFSSTEKITDKKNDPGVYRLFLKPTSQTLTIKYSNLDDTYIFIENLDVKEVRYYYVHLPNKFRNIQTKTTDKSISVGSYRIETDPPGAVIEMYGSPPFNREENKTPFTFEGYETGSKILTLNLIEYEPVTDTIQIGSRKVNKSKYKLIPEFAFVNLNISPEPPYSKIFINNNEIANFRNGQEYKVGKGDVSVVVNADHYYPASKIINTIAGKVHDVSIELKPIMGTITITTNNEGMGSDVYIDDLLVGQLPLLNYPIQESEYTIKAVNKLYVTEKEFYSSRIKEDQETSLQINFVENKSIKIITEPVKAEVYINGEKIGNSNLTTKLGIGSYRISIAKENYDTLYQVISVDHSTSSFAFKLEKSKIPLKLKNKGDIKVYVNSEYKGKLGSPILLSEGKYSLKLTKQGTFGEQVFVGKVDFPQVNNKSLPIYTVNKSGPTMNIVSYEYNTISHSSVISVLNMGVSGWMMSLFKLRIIEDYEGGKMKVLPSILFLNSEFSLGGALLNGIDISLSADFDYSWSMIAEDKDDASKNKDKYTSINYFYGIKLQSRNSNNGSLISPYLKLGIFNNSNAINLVNNDFSYGSDIKYGLGMFSGISLGVSIINTDNTILRLWRKPILSNLRY
ncbi:MAG TPA: PEGA domain-containing protein [Bacteroidales bacterium]|nr:PEGA domain-containing protein [Bacteroidales bacterium]